MRFEAFECKFEPFKSDSKHSNTYYKNCKGIPTIQTKLEILKPNSKRSNGNSNHFQEIRSIRMQILTIRKGFETFECKFELFERDSKHSDANSSHSKGIQSIRMHILTIEKGF